MMQTYPQTQIIIRQVLRLTSGRYSSVRIIRNTITLVIF